MVLGDTMTDLSSADLCRMSVQEVADLLLEKLDENLKNDKEYSCAKIIGKHDDELYELLFVMRGVNDGEE